MARFVCIRKPSASRRSGRAFGESPAPMTKRVPIAAAVIGAALTIAIVTAMRPQEPSYDGRSLREWLSDMYQSSHLFFPTNDPTDLVMGPRRERAASSVRSIGTNAVPILLSMLGSKDSALKLGALALYGKLGFVAKPYSKSPERWRCALMGFDVLRAHAKSAQPDLVKIALGSNGEQRMMALNALYMIDPQCYRDTRDLLEARK